MEKREQKKMEKEKNGEKREIKRIKYIVEIKKIKPQSEGAGRKWWGQLHRHHRRTGSRTPRRPAHCSHNPVSLRNIFIKGNLGLYI